MVGDLTDNWAFYAEITLVYGGALSWAFYELWWLRRDRKRREAKEEAERAERQSKVVY